MSLLYQLASYRQVSGLRRSIEDFIFTDDVRFQLGSLSMNSLNRKGAKRSADEQYHCISKSGFHGKVPPLGRQLNCCLARAATAVPAASRDSLTMREEQGQRTGSIKCSYCVPGHIT